MNTGCSDTPEWVEIIHNSRNPRVLTMLSGGKDSIAAICLLKRKGLDVSAVHFIHKWCSSIPTEEAERICRQMDIPLRIIDFTNEFYQEIHNFTDGRPCALCKKKMYQILIRLLETSDFGWLCIGDTANDRTTIMRMRSHIGSGKNESLVCSTYFGSEMGLELPAGIGVVRPLIKMTADETEQFLLSEGIQVRRINSTGDKYFEYHREGCFIQFADMGVAIDTELCDRLKEYNDVITEFARKENILASVHLPSTFIITIPKGYEIKAAEYLRKKGYDVDFDCNRDAEVAEFCCSADVQSLSPFLLETGAYIKLFHRFSERLELMDDSPEIVQVEGKAFCTAQDKDAVLRIIFDFDASNAFVSYVCGEQSTSIKNKGFFSNLIIELFRTRKFHII